MKILMLLDNFGSFPPDIRVEKESQALLDAGFEVVIICRKCRPDEADHEVTSSGLQILRIDFSRYIPANRRFFTKCLDYVRRKWSVAPLYDSWLRCVPLLISEHGPSAIHAHDLPLVPLAVRLGETFDIPVVADLHENWSASQLIESRCDGPPKRDFRSRLSYYRWRRLERKILRRCTQVIVVVDEAMERIAKYCSVDRTRVTTISNTESAETLEIITNSSTAFDDNWTALYIGGVGGHRGIDTAIRAAAIAGPHIQGFQLQIVGARGNSAELVAFANQVGAGNYVDIVEWVSREQVPTFIANSSACLVPHNSCEQTDTTVPHKLFQYMLSRKPVIVSDCPPLRRIIEETGAGRVFRAGDASDLADKLIELHLSPTDSAQFASCGEVAASGHYCWERDAKMLVSLYRQLLNAGDASERVHVYAKGFRTIA
jgi:glycosyltransferase involved in cell wall biosynthesis